MKKHLGNLEAPMTTDIPRIITKKELRQLVPFSPQYVLRLEKEGRFPHRIKIGERRVGWWLHEVLAWLAEREAQGARIRRFAEDQQCPSS
jgi:prophage regulatory protein